MGPSDSSGADLTNLLHKGMLRYKPQNKTKQNKNPPEKQLVNTREQNFFEPGIASASWSPEVWF